jgi:hypothetical protein
MMYSALLMPLDSHPFDMPGSTSAFQVWIETL